MAFVLGCMFSEKAVGKRPYKKTLTKYLYLNRGCFGKGLGLYLRNICRKKCVLRTHNVVLKSVDFIKHSKKKVFADVDIILFSSYLENKINTECNGWNRYKQRKTDKRQTKYS